MKCILIRGIPGSGKTSYAKSFYSRFHLIDEPINLIEEISAHQGKNIVIVDHNFCKKEILQKAIEIFKGYKYSSITISTIRTPIKLCWKRIQEGGNTKNITYEYLKEFQQLLNK